MIICAFCTEMQVVRFDKISTFQIERFASTRDIQMLKRKLFV